MKKRYIQHSQHDTEKRKADYIYIQMTCDGNEHVCLHWCHILSFSSMCVTNMWVLLGDSGGVVNSLDFCLALLMSLGCFYFWCVLSTQWKAVTVNLRILHCQR